jgi:cardiolipin synthase
MKKFMKILTSRIFLFAVSVTAQMVWILLLFTILNQWFPWLDTFITCLAVVSLFVIFNKRSNSSYRLVWTLLILAFPIFGVLFYLLYGNSRLKLKMRRQFLRMQEIGASHLKENDRVRESLEETDREASRQSVYLRTVTGFPLYVNESSKYYATGDDAMPDMLKALESAKYFIFMEYFIISPGYFWDQIHEILKRKVKEGVDVRVIYDDFGCAGTLPYHYYKTLQAEGIKCACFNPLRFIASIVMNNRDHRKILVVDGRTAFTGGFNIADEYINQKVRFGHWKDAGVRVTGNPVWSFTSMFLQMWSVITGMQEEDIDRYGPLVIISPEDRVNDGYVQPYSDMPLDDVPVGENVYLQLINRAQDYVYIFTPYLIVTDEMMSALTIAGRRGVDVRIVTPHVPDKKLVFLITQSTYQQLLESGIRIYEYTPGFIHSKVMVSDDSYAVVGSINLDYRSLYLQYEDAVWFYDAEVVRDIREDALATFDVSGEITLAWVKKRSIFLKLLMNVMRVFAPLM